MTRVDTAWAAAVVNGEPTPTGFFYKSEYAIIMLLPAGDPSGFNVACDRPDEGYGEKRGRWLGHTHFDLPQERGNETDECFLPRWPS